MIFPVLAESPGTTSRTFWQRKEQPKLPAHLRHQPFKPAPSPAVADFNTLEMASVDTGVL